MFFVEEDFEGGGTSVDGGGDGDMCEMGESGEEGEEEEGEIEVLPGVSASRKRKRKKQRSKKTMSDREKQQLLKREEVSVFWP